MPTFNIPLSITVRLGEPQSVPAPALSATSPGSRVVEKMERGSLSTTGRFLESTDFFNANKLRFVPATFANPAFSNQTALNLALASSLAYETSNDVKSVAGTDWHFDGTEPFEVGDTQGFVAWTSTIVIVVYRGTEAVGDWLTNLSVFSQGTTYGNIHRGFLYEFRNSRQKVDSLLGLANADSKKIFLAGHSLGGALATVASMEWFGIHPIAAVYTFGQPAVGFTALRSSVEVRYPDRFHRFVNEGDIVPRVPPWPYRHAGRLHHLLDNGTVSNESATRGAVTAPGEDETPTMSPAEFEALQTRLRATRPIATATEATTGVPRGVVEEGMIPGVEQHRMDNYLHKIIAQL